MDTFRTLSPFVLTLALVAVLPATAQGDGSAGPPTDLVVQVELGLLTAVGFEPGAEAIVFGVARVPGGYVTRVLQRAERVAADETGTMTYEAIPSELLPAGELSFDPTALAVWVVVDPADGDYVVVTPDGSRARERPFNPRALERGADGLTNRLTQELRGGHLLMVRPQESRRGNGNGQGDGETEEPDGESPEPAGVWALSLEDGSLLDLDGERNGSFRVALDSWRPVGDGPEPPEEVEAGDLIFVIEPTTLEFSIVRFVGQGG